MRQLKCTYCPNVVERIYDLEIVRCFDCKKRARKQREFERMKHKPFRTATSFEDRYYPELMRTNKTP